VNQQDEVGEPLLEFGDEVIRVARILLAPLHEDAVGTDEDGIVIQDHRDHRFANDGPCDPLFPRTAPCRVDGGTYDCEILEIAGSEIAPVGIGIHPFDARFALGIGCRLHDTCHPHRERSSDRRLPPRETTWPARLCCKTAGGGLASGPAGTGIAEHGQKVGRAGAFRDSGVVGSGSERL